jgi:hypothetical protein
VTAPAWLDMWAFARVRMGLSKREFFAMTPREFFKMHEVWRERERDTHRMFALLRVDLINHSFYRPTKPLELADLMPAARPGAGSGQAPPRRRRLTKKFRGEIADRMRQIFGAPAAPAGG